jgi:hypothetical protein
MPHGLQTMPVRNSQRRIWWSFAFVLTAVSSRGALALFAASPLFFALVFALAPLPATCAQATASTDGRYDSKHLTELVREVVRNEIENQLNDNSLWCFREQKEEDSKAERTLQVCQTKQGDVERLIAVNGREISSEQLQAEDQRVQKLIGHPDQLWAKQKKQREDAEQVRSLLRSFPDAFRFQYIDADGNLIKLNFKPNPSFHPSTRTALVFHHMEGTLIIDQQQKRMVEINGTLTNEVKFAAGLLGHLDKGGTFVVKSQEVAPGHWDTTLMDVQMNGRALFFKTIAVHDKESYSDYTPAPPGATLQQVAEFLKKECNSVHTVASTPLPQNRVTKTPNLRH